MNLQNRPIADPFVLENRRGACRREAFCELFIARLRGRRATQGTKWKRSNFSFAPADGRRCAAEGDWGEREKG